MAHKVTLPEVAQAAGVSLGSASRALHGSGASSAMVERVTKVARDLGYQADVRGRNLRSKQTFQIGFAVADIGNPVYVEMMTAIQEVIALDGFQLLVASTGNTAESMSATVRSLSSGMVDGVILSPLQVTGELARTVSELDIPAVVIGRAGGMEIDNVATDSATGIVSAFDHMVSGGRRRIAFLNGPVDTTPGEARRRGFDAAAAAHPEITCTLLDAADFRLSDGRETVRTALTAGLQCDAIVAANDLLAIGAMESLMDAGLRIPQDVAVSGMDDTEFARVFRPRLTSVSLGSAKRGRIAARLLLDRIRDPEISVRHELVAPALVERNSTMGSTEENE